LHSDQIREGFEIGGEHVRLKSAIYKALAISNDVEAVRKGKVGRRIARRVYGRLTGRLARKLFG